MRFVQPCWGEIKENWAQKNCLNFFLNLTDLEFIQAEIIFIIFHGCFKDSQSYQSMTTDEALSRKTDE